MSQRHTFPKIISPPQNLPLAVLGIINDAEARLGVNVRLQIRNKSQTAMPNIQILCAV
jgi:hypothetical protein